MAKLRGRLTPSVTKRAMKRSIEIAGQKTSVSLEEEFWNSLKEIASERGTTPAALVAAIEALANTPIYRQLFDYLCLASIAIRGAE
jgi:predicted DNA-binding ribbon-helix-helix protein